MSATTAGTVEATVIAGGAQPSTGGTSGSASGQFTVAASHSVSGDLAPELRPTSEREPTSPVPADRERLNELWRRYRELRPADEVEELTDKEWREAERQRNNPYYVPRREVRVVSS
jgi:hypothetical protein